MGDQIAGLDTERRAGAELDRMPARDVVRAVVSGHRDVVAAVEAAEPAIAALVDAAAERLARGGRVVYVGAGTGGHLAEVDAAEWAPTFSVAAIEVLKAGAGAPAGSAGEAAAEDDAIAGERDARALELTAADVVLGISASGRTPYVLAAIAVATERGALTAGLTSNGDSPLAAAVEHPIAVATGAEVLSGSTRLKAGSAQKLVLNAFSTALMVRRGRTLGDLMAGMRVSNEKLRRRAVRVCVEATACTPEEAERALAEAGTRADVAVIMLARGLTAAEAAARLELTGGAIRAALDDANWS